METKAAINGGNLQSCNAIQLAFSLSLRNCTQKYLLFCGFDSIFSLFLQSFTRSVDLFSFIMAIEWSNVDYIGFAYAVIVAAGGIMGKKLL
jgi:hypothetical protein